jgi:hypothetical protein
MKHFIVSLMAAALLVPVFGQSPDKSVVKERRENQKDRIKAGVENGSLTKAEAIRLKQDQKEIREDVKDARSDGNVTAREKAKITREQNKASRKIAVQKHDKQNQK